MPHAVSTAAPGLQALILCGPGSSFPTFTADPDENPKALLPIANRPMVWYPLDFCYRMGITDITLICPPSAAQAITSALNINPHLTKLPTPSATLVSPKELNQNTGTAEILRLPEVRSRITSDFIVLPCDLVCELGGEKLLQAWMVKSAHLSDTIGEADSTAVTHNGGLSVWYETKTATPVKGEETDFIATASLQSPASPQPKDSLLTNISKLVYSMPTDSLNDRVEEKKGFPIRHGLLRNHPRIRMLTTHRDAHIYVFPRWILDFAQANERLESISEDIVGWWAKASWQAGLSEKLGLQKILRRMENGQDAESPREAPSEVDSDELTPQSASTTSQSQRAVRYRKRGAQVYDLKGKAPEPRSEHVPPILAYVHPSKDDAPLIRRVDNAQLLLATSLRLAKLPSVEETGSEAASPFAHSRKVAYPEGVKPRTTITRQDSLVAENVTVEEKTSIKESVIGANCQIREGAKLSQCLLMDGVVVGKGCKLTRCILGKRCEIGENSTLTDCEVQENLLVEPKTEEKDNKLMSSEGLEATEEELQEALQDMDEDDVQYDEVAVLG